MYCMKRLWVWLMRARHSRGFGVQSPHDYGFIRYVVNEHYPYYAYSELEREIPGLDSKERKMCRLYFRMANHLQPSTVVDCGSDSTAFARYVVAGCRKVRVAMDISRAESIDLLRLPLMGDYEAAFEQAMAKASASSVFVLEGIKSDRKARRFWAGLLRDERVGVTFDLYYAGVIFFDKGRYKQNYKVNF